MAEILQYIRKDGLFHNLNALSKIVFLVLVVVASVSITQIPILAGVVVVLFLLAVVGKLYRELLSQVPMLLVLSAGLLLLTVLTMQSGDVIGHLIPAAVPVIGGAFPITTGALTFAGILSFRFFAMIFAFQLVIISTQPRDLVYALQQLKFPVDYSLMLLIALRFIPSLQLEGKRISEAQLARAYNPGKGLTGKRRSLGPLIIPLVSNALGKANVLGLTIDLRGLRTHPRTVMAEQRLVGLDYAALVVMLCALVGLLWYLLF